MTRSAHSRRFSALLLRKGRLLRASLLAALAVLALPLSAQEDLSSTPFYRLLTPPTFYSSALDGLFSLNGQQDDPISEAVDETLIDFYLNHPELVRHTDRQWADQQTVEMTKTNDNQHVEEILEQTTKPPTVPDVHDALDDIALRIERPNFWKTTGSFSLQFTQNYFSDNWYKGGNNNQTLLAALILQANYNDQRKVTWENKLEMRLGFITTTADTCHTFLTSNDKINLYSKLGVKASKNWYYTATAEANSQFLPGHRTNDRRTYSKFLAPLDVYVSIGMDYKPTLKNGNTFSLALLPLSYKFRYLHRADENIHSVYNMVNTDFRQDFGSKLELNAKIKIANQLYWKCRAYYFTSYEYAEAELENTFSYAFSKYISTELYTLWRFDDNRSRQYFDDNLGYFQFKEYFTFGLKYEF